MILSSAVLLVIILPTMLSIIISLPNIQNRIIDIAAQYATDFLGAEVKIDRIDVSTRGDVVIDGFLSRDLQGDTLLYVGRATTPLLGFSSSQKELRLGSSSVSRAKLNLVAREVDGESIMNIKQIVALIASGDSQNPLKISIESVDIEDVDITIKQLTSRNPSYGVDYGDMSIENIQGRVDDLFIDGPRVNLEIVNLSLHERSGFELKNISSRLTIGRGALTMEKMSIETLWSKMYFDQLTLSGREWLHYRQFNQNVLMEIDLRSGYLSSNDIAYFVPTMKEWDIRLYDLQLSALGLVDGLNININNISYGEGTHISTELELSNASTIDNTYAKFSLDEFAIDAQDANRLIDSIDADLLTNEQRELINRIDELTIKGNAEGKLDSVEFNGSLSCNLGTISSLLSIDLTHRERVAIDGEVNIDRFDLGRLLNNNKLGQLTAYNSVKGVFGDKSQQSLTLCSEIGSIKVQNYTLNASRVEIDLQHSNADVKLSCKDPNMMLDIEAHVENYTAMGSGSGESATLDLTANIKEINFKELGLNIRDESSTLAAKLKVAGSGFNIDDISGSLTVTDAKYLFGDTTIATDLITLNMKDTKHGRIFTLDSEFADVVMNLSGSPTANLEYLKYALYSYLPALYDTKPNEPSKPEESIEHNTIAEQTSSNHLSLVNVKLHNITPIANAFDSDFEASVDTKGLMLFDPVNREFTVTVSSSYLERNAFLAIGLEAQLTNHGDSVSLFSRAKELYVGTTFMENSSIAGGANNNDINLNIGFVNQADSAHASIITAMHVAQSANGDRELYIELLPSVLSNATQQWDLSAQGVKINARGVDFDNLVVERENQRLVVNGRASSSLDDNIDLELQNFDLSVLSAVVSRVGYKINGYTNGHAMISSALREARIEANVALDSVSVNSIKSPDLQLLAQWDSQRNQARLHLLNRVNRDTVIRGYYIPSKVMYYAKLNVDSVNLNLLDPPLKGTIYDTEGYADVDIALIGERRAASLEGAISCYDVATTIGYTGVRYSLDRGVVEVKDNTLTASGFVVNDAASGGRGSATMDLSVDLSRLNNVSYNLKVQPQRMLVLNTTANDNDLFYGKVNATGVAEIKGDRNGVDMDITAVTNNNSQFFMPLNSKSSISRAEFITFVEPKVLIDTTNIVMRKRESFQRQQAEHQEGANINLKLALQVRSNTDVQVVIDPTVGDIIRAKGDGNFNLQIEPKKNIFEIYGDYTITEGNYLFTLGNIVNKRFTINPGSTIQWSGEPLEATLDIAAVYKLKTSLQPLLADESTRAVPVDCIINLTDRLMQPDISFEIELPSSDVEQQSIVANLLNDQETLSRQFFYLMLSNSFIPETTGSSSSLGVTATAATGFELLANQLSNWLSTSNYNVILRYRPESDLTSDEIDVGFSKGWIDNRLLIELEGNYIADNKQAVSENASNFMGEAYVTWLIDPAGALRLRGFTQTVDRYDENQGLQETGVGIYYTESFDNFKDLRKRVKARFSARPEREEKRAKRKDERAAKEGLKGDEDQEKEKL
ncbi:MAG: translocation/assembly module TamB domain-containing protein [Rikenellaceae bacterium]